MGQNRYVNYTERSKLLATVTRKEIKEKDEGGQSCVRKASSFRRKQNVKENGRRNFNSQILFLSRVQSRVMDALQRAVPTYP